MFTRPLELDRAAVRASLCHVTALAPGRADVGVDRRSWRAFAGCGRLIHFSPAVVVSSLLGWEGRDICAAEKGWPSREPMAVSDSRAKGGERVHVC